MGWKRKGWDGGTEKGGMEGQRKEGCRKRGSEKKGKEEERGRYGGREREGVVKKTVKLKVMYTHLFFLMKE